MLGMLAFLFDILLSDRTKQVLPCLTAVSASSLIDSILSLRDFSMLKVQSITLVFLEKKRIKKNPLIVHYYDLKQASKDVIFDKKFLRVYNKFSPGPITYIVKKKSD